MRFQDPRWNISMSSLVILHTSVSEISCGKNKTDKQTPVIPIPMTAVGLDNNTNSSHQLNPLDSQHILPNLSVLFSLHAIPFDHKKCTLLLLSKSNSYHMCLQILYPPHHAVGLNLWKRAQSAHVWSSFNTLCNRHHNQWRNFGLKSGGPALPSP